MKYENAVVECNSNSRLSASVSAAWGYKRSMDVRVHEQQQEH